MLQILKKKCQRKFKESYSEETGMTLFQQLMIALTLSILFGLGWGIGLPASGAIFETPVVRNIFAASFIILTGFQGLFIFIMHCLRSAEVRKEWKSWVFKLTGIKAFETFSSMANSSVIQRRKTNASTITKASFISRTELPLQDGFAIDEKVVEMSIFEKALDTEDMVSPVLDTKDMDTKDMVFPVPPLDLELSPSDTSLGCPSSINCVNFENPFDYGTRDALSPCSPTSNSYQLPTHSPLKNPLLTSTGSEVTNGVVSSEVTNGVVNEDKY